MNAAVSLKQGQNMQRERKRERFGAFCFHLANECTLTSLGKTVTGCLHKVRWKMALHFHPLFFLERDGRWVREYDKASGHLVVVGGVGGGRNRITGYKKEDRWAFSVKWFAG